MGSGQSTRKLTIENEEVGFIQISEAVVKRITSQANEMNANAVDEVRPTPVTESSAQTVVSPPVSQGGDASVNSAYATYPQFTLTALQMQQQKVAELNSQDIYWQKRLKNLEEKHSQINNIIDEEYRKAVEQLYSDGKKRGNIQDTIQPCKDSSEDVLKCYQENPREILKCANLVQEFSNCVDQRRANVIAARC